MTDDFIPYSEAHPSVELRHISKQFGDVRAVDGLSLTIDEGEFITLLGPSGCGKTTTLRMIGGFEYPATGSISIHGELMGNRPPHKRPVNTVFQNYALFPHMTVAQNIGYGLEMTGVSRGDRERRVGEALELVRLPHIEKRKPHELSGGQQQRVALARALVNKPKVLLLDEPLGALDLKLRKAMQLELKALNREVGITFVYVTHDQEEALTMSDRIAVMSQGKILQLGAPEEIYERPNSVFVADFIGQTNMLQGQLERSSEGFGEVGLPGSGVIRAKLANPSTTAGKVTVTVRPEKVRFATDFAVDGVPAGWNSVQGVVREIVYLGTHTQYVVDLPEQAAMLVHHQNRGLALTGSQSGAHVTLVFDPEQATVLNG